MTHSREIFSHRPEQCLPNKPPNPHPHQGRSHQPATPQTQSTSTNHLPNGSSSHSESPAPASCVQPPPGPTPTTTAQFHPTLSDSISIINARIARTTQILIRNARTRKRINEERDKNDAERKTAEQSRGRLRALRDKAASAAQQSKDADEQIKEATKRKEEAQTLLNEASSEYALIVGTEGNWFVDSPEADGSGESNHTRVSSPAHVPACMHGVTERQTAPTSANSTPRQSPWPEVVRPPSTPTRSPQGQTEPSKKRSRSPEQGGQQRLGFIGPYPVKHEA